MNLATVAEFGSREEAEQAVAILRRAGFHGQFKNQRRVLNSASPKATSTTLVNICSWRATGQARSTQDARALPVLNVAVSKREKFRDTR